MLTGQHVAERIMRPLIHIGACRFHLSRTKALAACQHIVTPDRSRGRPYYCGPVELLAIAHGSDGTSNHVLPDRQRTLRDELRTADYKAAYLVVHGNRYQHPHADVPLGGAPKQPIGQPSPICGDASAINERSDSIAKS